jgi:glutathione S-transferase
VPIGPTQTVAEAPEFTIVGRSSSHFTRVTRIFAVELGIAAALRVVPDLTSSRAADYAGNPALRVPALVAASGTWFGALNVCRELARRSRHELRLIWPEALAQPLLANAQELTLQAMSTEVTLIMGSWGGSELPAAHRDKLAASLRGCLLWLEENVEAVLVALPARELSYLEVTLFCLFTHLDFRGLAPTAEYARLAHFSGRFADRVSARSTPYRFDAPA